MSKPMTLPEARKRIQVVLYPWSYIKCERQPDGTWRASVWQRSKASHEPDKRLVVQGALTRSAALAGLVACVEAGGKR